MLLEQERYYGLGMDALIIVCSWNRNVIIVWAWMLWSSYVLGTRTELWFGHACSGRRMPLEQERYNSLGMDVLVSVCSAGGSTWRQRGFPCAPTLEPHQLQRNLVGTTERRVHEAASHLKQGLAKGRLQARREDTQAGFVVCVEKIAS